MHVLSMNRREPLHELVDGRSLFDMVEERCNGHAGAPETPDAGELAGAPVDSSAETPVHAAIISDRDMKKNSRAERPDELRKEYDLSKLSGGVRGKYFRPASAGTNLVLIDPDLARIFPDGEAVNRALRVVAEAAKGAVSRKRRERSR